MREKQIEIRPVRYALRSKTLRDPVGPGLWLMRGIPNGFGRDAASKVLNHLSAESPGGLKLHALQSSEEEKAFRFGVQS